MKAWKSYQNDDWPADIARAHGLSSILLFILFGIVSLGEWIFFQKIFRKLKIRTSGHFIHKRMARSEQGQAADCAPNCYHTVFHWLVHFAYFWAFFPILARFQVFYILSRQVLADLRDFSVRLFFKTK